MRVGVTCRPGHRGEPVPRRLALGQKMLDVVEEVDRWLAQDHRYFKVRCEDGGLYILRHDTVRDEWELTMFEAQP